MTYPSVFKQLWHTIHKPKLFLGLILSFISTLISLVIPSFIGDNIDESFILKLSHNSDLLLNGVLILLLTYCIQGLSSYLLSTTSNDATTQLQKKFTNHIFQTPPQILSQYQIGDIVSRLTNDLFNLSKLFAITIPQIFISSILFLGSFIFLFSISYQLSLMCLCLVPLLTLALVPLNQKLEFLFFRQQELLGKLNGILNNKLKHIRLIKAFLGEKDDLNFLNKSLEKFNSIFKKIIRYSIIQQFFSQLILFGGFFYTILYANQLVQNSQLTAGELVAFILYIFQLLSPIFNIIETLDEFSELRSINKRIQTIFTLPKEKYCKQTVSLSGDITFKEFSFSYKDSKIITPTLNFTIPKGSHLAILGPSGSGKSTLFSLLLKYLDGYKGSVTLNNHELSALLPNQTRQRIAYTSPNAPLFNISIRENMIYGKNKEITDEHIKKVFEQLNLTSLIETLPLGLDTIISENGDEFSAGEKQRFCIARTLLCEADLYLFDEVTANLDQETEMIICKAIKHCCSGKTIFSISHRPETVKEADFFLSLNPSNESAYFSHLNPFQAGKLL